MKPSGLDAVDEQITPAVRAYVQMVARHANVAEGRADVLAHRFVVVALDVRYPHVVPGVVGSCVMHAVCRVSVTLV